MLSLEFVLMLVRSLRVVMKPQTRYLVLLKSLKMAPGASIGMRRKNITLSLKMVLRFPKINAKML